MFPLSNVWILDINTSGHRTYKTIRNKFWKLTFLSGTGKTPEKPANTANFTANSLSDVRTDEVYSSEDVPSIQSEQIPAPVPAKTTEFEPPSRIPPEFLAHPKPQTIVEPNSAKFTCRVVGDPKPSVTWSRNGVVLSDSGRFEIYEEKDDFVLEVFDTTTQDTGTYVCTATNLAGQKMAEASLTVESKLHKFPKQYDISTVFIRTISRKNILLFPLDCIYFRSEIVIERIALSHSYLLMYPLYSQQSCSGLTPWCYRKPHLSIWHLFLGLTAGKKSANATSIYKEVMISSVFLNVWILLIKVKL